jgi:hypothetical protein
VKIGEFVQKSEWKFGKKNYLRFVNILEGLIALIQIFDNFDFDELVFDP